MSNAHALRRAATLRISERRTAPHPARSTPTRPSRRTTHALATCTRLLCAVALALTLYAATGAASAAGDPAKEIAALLQAGKIREAADRAHLWAEADPGNLEALQQCAALSRRVGSYHVAEDALRSLLFFMPNDPEALIKLGEVLIDRGRYAEAREHFEDAIRMDDSLVGAYVGLARLARFESTDEGEILSAAQVAVSVGPQDPSALTSMGAALNACGRFEEAARYLEQVIAGDESYAPALFELGLSRAFLGAREEARAQWRRYVALEPETAQAWLLRNNLVVTEVKPLMDRAWYATYSPDGSRIAYRGRGAGGWGVYVAPADDLTQESRIWSTESNLQALSWSPDGSSLLTRVYEKTEVEQKGKKTQQWVYRILTIPADGKGETKEITQGRWLGEPTWIPATGHIAVRSYIPKHGYAILDIDPDTGDSKQLPGVDARLPYYTPRWSPDGSKWFATRRSAQHPDGSYSYQLLVAPAANLAKAQVIFETPDSVRTPSLSQNGAFVLFTITGGQGSGHYPIWAMPADGSREPCPVYHAAGSYTAPSLSPDGKYMLSSNGQMLVRLTLEGLAGEQ